MADALQRAGQFLAESGRDIDRALFDYTFSEASRKVVTDALAGYQNDDGGFHGLEVDIAAPDSNPFATELALQIFIQADLPRDSKIVQSAVRYLEEIAGRRGQLALLRGRLSARSRALVPRLGVAQPQPFLHDCRTAQAAWPRLAATAWSRRAPLRAAGEGRRPHERRILWRAPLCLLLPVRVGAPTTRAVSLRRAVVADPPGRERRDGRQPLLPICSETRLPIPPGCCHGVYWIVGWRCWRRSSRKTVAGQHPTSRAGVAG